MHYSNPYLCEDSKKRLVLKSERTNLKLHKSIHVPTMNPHDLTIQYVQNNCRMKPVPHASLICS